MRRKNGPSDLQDLLARFLKPCRQGPSSTTTGAHLDYLSSQSALSFLFCLKSFASGRPRLFRAQWFSACFHADMRRLHPWWANYGPPCCATKKFKNKNPHLLFMKIQSPNSHMASFYSIHFCPCFLNLGF